MLKGHILATYYATTCNVVSILESVVTISQIPRFYKRDMSLPLQIHPVKTIFLSTALVVFATPLLASDHRDSPFTKNMPEADIGDVFLWKGSQTGGLAMAMTLNPLSGSKIEGTKNQNEITLSPDLLYVFNFDTDGDAIADISYKIKAGPDDGQEQTLELRRATGVEASDAKWTGTPHGKGMTTALNTPLQVVKGKAGELLFSGPRRDPFFFNFNGVNAPTALAITQALAGGDHLPAKKNSLEAFGVSDMSLIVLEVPDLEKQKLNFWVTVADGNGATVDRMGRAGIQGIYLVDAPSGYNEDYYQPRNSAKHPTIGHLNNAYNASKPDQDGANYSEQFTYRFQQLEVKSAEVADKVAFYLPDMLSWDPNAPTGYPNGRNLQEDAIFWTIQDLNPFYKPDPTAQKVPPFTSDQPISDRFPYVAPSSAQAFKGSSKDPIALIYMK